MKKIIKLLTIISICLMLSGCIFMWPMKTGTYFFNKTDQTIMIRDSIVKKWILLKPKKQVSFNHRVNLQVKINDVIYDVFLFKDLPDDFYSMGRKYGNNHLGKFYFVLTSDNKIYCRPIRIESGNLVRVANWDEIVNNQPAGYPKELVKIND